MMLLDFGIALALAAVVGAMKFANYMDTKDAKNKRNAYVDTLFADIVRLRDYARDHHCFLARALAERAAIYHDKQDYREAETLARICAIELSEHGFYCRVNFEAFAS